jgi:scyllo-inositol 2-dehydrogenase (NADP+)
VIQTEKGGCRVELAIIGTGGIVKEALKALEKVPMVHCLAIYGREHSRGKAEDLAAKHDISLVYTDYEELLQNEKIEFVYIGLVNSAHYSYAKQALLADKNVIVEKPLTSTYAEAVELAQLAQERKLFFFEAVTLLHMPNFELIKESLAALGKIRLVQCNYSQYSSRYDKYKEGIVLPAFAPQLSGGALYDINIYNLNFVVGLFGRPFNVSYIANMGFNGIDTSGTAIMRYDDFFAVCTGAKDSASPGFLLIQGEDGYIRVDGASNMLQSVEIGTGDTIVEKNINLYIHRMVHEFIAFNQMYEKNDKNAMASYMQISLNVIYTAEQARKAAGIRFAADKI